MATAGYRRIRKLGEEPTMAVTTPPKNNKAEGGYIGWALLSGLGIAAGLFALAYKIFHKTWKLGDVLSVPSPEGATVNVGSLGSGATDAAGKYSTGLVNKGSYAFSVSKPNYATVTGGNVVIA